MKRPRRRRKKEKKGLVFEVFEDANGQYEYNYKEKMKELGAYQTANLRMATGFLLNKFGGKEGDAMGPKTQLERVVEDNMRKLRGRSRPFA